MKHYLFIALPYGGSPVTSISEYTMFDEFEKAFNALTEWCYAEFGPEHVKVPKSGATTYNLTKGGYHLQIWEVKTPEMPNS